MRSLFTFCVSFCTAVALVCQAASVHVTAAAREAAVPDPAIYKHVSHLGWVVRDLGAVAAAWRALGVTDIQDGGVQEYPVVHRGKPVTARVRMAFARFGNGTVEWIQPLGDGTAYTEFLERHGEGVHHVAYAVPSEARLKEEVARYQSLGIGLVQEGTWTTPAGAGHFAYLDTAPEGGGVVLALEYDPAAAAGAGTATSNEDPFTRITQYAFVVRDVHKVSAFYERTGLGALPVEKNVSLDRVFRGRPGRFEMLLGWGRQGDVVFEWIQSLVGPNVYEEHLKQYGEGFHHLGFNVSDMDAAVAKLRSRGLDVTMSGGWNTNGHEGRFAYLDADKHGGVTIELLWNKPR